MGGHDTLRHQPDLACGRVSTTSFSSHCQPVKQNLQGARGLPRDTALYGTCSQSREWDWDLSIRCAQLLLELAWALRSRRGVEKRSCTPTPPLNLLDYL